MKINKNLAIPGPETQAPTTIGGLKMSPDSPLYPEVHLETKEGLGLPKSGTITFKYRTVSETERRRNGNESYSCTLELQQVVSASGEKDIRPSKRDTSTEDALDALAKEKAESATEEAGEPADQEASE